MSDAEQKFHDEDLVEEDEKMVFRLLADVSSGQVSAIEGFKTLKNLVFEEVIQ